MNREEIENRIIICEQKAKDYREVGNTKTADRYDNEKYKWEKILSDLNLLDERKIYELLEYKKGYLNLEQENQQLKEEINKMSKKELKVMQNESERNKQLQQKIKQFCIYYFSDMPRDRYNFRFRWQQALCYLDWYIEDIKAREKSGANN